MRVAPSVGDPSRRSWSTTRRRAGGHVPVVGLVEVVVQADDAAGGGRRGCPAPSPAPPGTTAAGRSRRSSLARRRGRRASTTRDAVDARVGIDGDHPRSTDGVVAEHADEWPRSLRRADDLAVAADQRVDEPGDADRCGCGQHHRVLDLAVDDLAVVADGGERADVAVTSGCRRR